MWIWKKCPVNKRPTILGIQMVNTLECFHCYVKPPPRYKLMTFKLSIADMALCIFSDLPSRQPRSLSRCAPGLTGQTTSWWTAASPPSAWPEPTGCSWDKVRWELLSLGMMTFSRQPRRGDQGAGLRQAGLQLPEPGARPVEDRDLGGGGDLQPRLPRGHGVGGSAGLTDPVVLLWHGQVRGATGQLDKWGDQRQWSQYWSCDTCQV